MANFVFNISGGQWAEYYRRIKNNDPANSAFIVVILATAGLETDAVLQDKDTLADVLSGTTNEATNTGYARKTLTDADLAAVPAPDDTNNRFEIDIPDQTWAAVAAGDGWSKLLLCYDPDTTAGTDANIIPISAHDFVVTPDSSDITAVMAAAGVVRSQL